LKIGGSYTVPIASQLAYVKLQDPEILARCMPGCDHLEKIGEDEYEMKMKVMISSVQGLFGGKVRLADQSPPDSFRLLVEGSGKVGFLKGMIAGVGQRLLDVTAKLIIKKFFEKFTGAVQSSD
jgi:carbon monoxide dehydrogenase subunit G